MILVQFAVNIYIRPETACLVKEFEGTDESDERMHHEQYPKFQSDYKSDIIALVDAFEQLGNPFLERLKTVVSFWTWTSHHLCLQMW